MRRLLALGTMMMVTGWTLAGSAQDGEDTILPLPEAARPLVSPPMTVRGDFHVLILQFGFPGFSQTVVGFPFLGAGISLADWVQLDAAVIPVVVSPSGEFHSPELGATFSFTENDADFEIGAKASFLIPGTTELYGLNMGLPIRLHLVVAQVLEQFGMEMAAHGSDPRQALQPGFDHVRAVSLRDGDDTDRNQFLEA